MFYKFILLIDLGDLIVLSSLTTNAQSTWILNIFKPPVVEPEQPPTNIIIKNIVFAKYPQFEKFSVEYPVPVIIDRLLNNDNLNAKKILILSLK